MLCRLLYIKNKFFSTIFRNKFFFFSVRTMNGWLIGDNIFIGCRWVTGYSQYFAVHCDKVWLVNRILLMIYCYSVLEINIAESRLYIYIYILLAKIILFIRGWWFRLFETFRRRLWQSIFSKYILSMFGGIAKSYSWYKIKEI